MQTAASGARVKTRQKGAKKAFSCVVDMDLKNNKGMVKEKQSFDWDVQHGTSVEFLLDGRIQVNGEAGLLNYLRGTILLNPHMSLTYDITDVAPAFVERVSSELPLIPPATEPHPHTMKLGEFISHARLYGRMKCASWLKKGFSRINEATLKSLHVEQKLPAAILSRNIDALSEEQFKNLFAALQNAKLMAPATTSVLSVGEDALALSVRRLGDIDFFAVLTRKPTICDFKPVQIEVAIARLKQRSGAEMEEPVQVLRFANRVPLQFDKAACAIVKAITSVNWRSYGLKQPKNALPLGPYIIAVSVVSPFIKFKNASKETIDASDELVEELRRALMQTGQRLSRYLAREHKAGELEQRVQHIEQFGPILIEALARILNAPQDRKDKAFTGLAKILEKDTKGIAQDLAAAEGRLASYLEEKKQRLGAFFEDIERVTSAGMDDGDVASVDPRETEEEFVTIENAGSGGVEQAKGKSRSSGKKKS
jgi:DNA topoisomerase-6 subunit B